MRANLPAKTRLSAVGKRRPGFTLIEMFVVIAIIFRHAV